MEKSHYTEPMREYIDAEIERNLEEVPIRIKIDGMDMEIEENSIEIDRDGGEINISINIGIKRMIQRHPGEYNDELHYGLFTKIELTDLLMKV